MLLQEAETETKIGNNIIYSKIRQLISWEGLYIEMLQFQYEFKNFGLFLHIEQLTYIFYRGGLNSLKFKNGSMFGFNIKTKSLILNFIIWLNT